MNALQSGLSQRTRATMPQLKPVSSLQRHSCSATAPRRQPPSRIPYTPAPGPAAASASSGPSSQPGPGCGSSSHHGAGLGLLFEVDGAVMDIHMEGHRVAFNSAFHSIGMDCVSWTPAVYSDLLGCSDGSGEGLVRTYYSTVGWPLMLATSDRGAFAAKVHSLKEAELGRLLARDGVPLREDVKQVISDAVSDGAAVSLLAGTQCAQGEALAASCVRQLGSQLAGGLRVFTFALVPPDAAEEGAGAGGGGAGQEGSDAPTPMLSQLMSAAAGDLKQRAAMQLICSWKAAGRGEEGAGGAVGLGVDPSLLAAGGAQQRISPGFLAALAATTGVRPGCTLAVAASGATVQAAAGAGMVPVAVPRKLATQGTFPGAVAKFEGFGAGLATWARLRHLLVANGSSCGSAGPQR